MTQTHPPGEEKNSYDLIDKDRFWQQLAIKPGMTVLDLGCGAGRYSLPLARRLKPGGKVIGLDLWAQGLGRLKTEAAGQGIENIETCQADAAKPFPFGDQSFDACLMATVLHDFVSAGTDAHVLRETVRVLKPGAILAVVEFKKQLTCCGPPQAVRLCIEDIAVRLQPLGFIRFSAVTELGSNRYFSQFRRLPGPVLRDKAAL
ncbi:MAG: class I SAM-dependent methyltransferase [Desulfobacteraceae bacterium]|nr:class I SAM-dependent methyltransferase [Desulfobacteraceae bacterium]